MPLPLLLVLGLVALILFSKKASASSLPRGAGEVFLPAGPSSANGSFNPAAIPTTIHPIAVDEVTAGENRFGGNEADPRIAGGSWVDESTGDRCTYDRHALKTTCVGTRNVCGRTDPFAGIFQAVGACGGGVPTPPPVLVPPPPPPPQR